MGRFRLAPPVFWKMEEHILTNDTITISLLNYNKASIPVIQDPQLLYVLRNECSLSWGDVSFSLAPGDFFLVSSLQSCTCNLLSSHGLIAVFRISYTYLSEQLGNPFVNLRCMSICENNPMHREIQSLAQQILSYYVSSSPLDRFRLQASCLDLIYLLIRFFTLADATTAADTAQPKSDRMFSILRYLHQNYNQPITLQSLADHFYLSIPYLSKLFKKNLGLNFLKYLNKIRIEHAVEDLKATSHTVSQIAFEHGFSSLASFNRTFRDIYGQSPSTYRKDCASEIRADDSQQFLRQFLERHPFRVQSNSIPPLICRADTLSAQPYRKNWQDTLSLGVASDLTHSWAQSQIAQLKQSLHFSYGYVWRLFCKETLVTPAAQTFNFSYLDSVLDFLTQTEIIPFLDLGFRAKQLVLNVNYATNTDTSSRISELTVAAMDNPSQYKNLLSSFIRHCIERYGEKNVETWRFCLHFDPGIPFSGDGLSWFKIFSDTSGCLKTYLPSAHLGMIGIFTYDDNKTFEEFLSQIVKKEYRLDFIGVSIYPYSLMQEQSLNNPASLDESFMLHKIHALQKLLMNYGLSEIPLYVTEWNLSFASRNYLHDSIYKGAYIIKNVIDCLHQTDSLTYWGSLDLLYEYYDSNQMLNGAPGLLSKNRIPKPAFHAFSFLAHLKNQLLSLGAHYIITMDGRNNYCIVCHNFCPPNTDYYYQYGEKISCEKVDALFQTAPVVLTFRIDNVKTGRYLIKKKFVNQKSGNLLAEWIHSGKPDATSMDEQSYLSAISIPRQTSETADAENNVLDITTILESNEIQLLQVIYQLE